MNATRITKSALIEMMLAYEPVILKAKGEFLSNEINHSQDIWVHTKHQDLYLVDFYQEIEWTYNEIKVRYAKPLEVTIPSKMNIDKRSLNGNRKIILNTETGILYFGYREAAESIGMKTSTLSSMVNGQNKNTTNLIHA